MNDSRRSRRTEAVVAERDFLEFVLWWSWALSDDDVLQQLPVNNPAPTDSSGEHWYRSCIGRQR